MVNRKSTSLLLLCFLPLLGAALGSPLPGLPAIASSRCMILNGSSIHSIMISISSEGHEKRNAAAHYGNIEREDPMLKDTATAVRFDGTTDSQGFPPATAWDRALALRFDTDWQGKNADAPRETEVRLLWTPEMLYLRFRARYREITVFTDAEPSGRRDQLWDRDVVEVFLQPDPTRLHSYKEFEVSPNGFWIDLDIADGEKRDLHSGLKRRMQMDEREKQWVAELSIPMKSLVAQFDPSAVWRVNFYRVEGPAEQRFFSAWRPTGTPQPNFHVPEAFGKLVFAHAGPERSPKN